MHPNDPKKPGCRSPYISRERPPEVTSVVSRIGAENMQFPGVWSRRGRAQRGMLVEPREQDLPLHWAVLPGFANTKTGPQ